jgi:cytochrome P450
MNVHNVIEERFKGPGGSMSPHTASDDVKVGGYRIPKGAVVIPNLDSVMHDETIFPATA